MSAADLLDATLYGLAALSGALAARAVMCGRTREWRALTVAGLGLVMAAGVLLGQWLNVAVLAVAIAIVLGSDWRNRRGRKVAKAIGERGRAVIAGLVEKVRDAGPPLPEGARA